MLKVKGAAHFFMLILFCLPKEINCAEDFLEKLKKDPDLINWIVKYSSLREIFKYKEDEQQDCVDEFGIEHPREYSGRALDDLKLYVISMGALHNCSDRRHAYGAYDFPRNIYGHSQYKPGVKELEKFKEIAKELGESLEPKSPPYNAWLHEIRNLPDGRWRIIFKSPQSGNSWYNLDIVLASKPK